MLFFRAQLAQFTARKVTSTAAAYNVEMEADLYASEDRTFEFLIMN